MRLPKPTKANITLRVERSIEKTESALHLIEHWQPRGAMRDRRRDVQDAIRNANLWLGEAKNLLEAS